MVACGEVDGLMLGSFMMRGLCEIRKVSRSELIQSFVWATYQIVSLTEWPVKGLR